MQAAFDGSKEISFTIISMTISLAAVFIPVLFMGGIVGRLLHEFSVTIAAAILVSGLVSISLTPMLCSRFLKPPHSQKHGRFYNATERMFDSWLRAYDWSLRLSLKHSAAHLRDLGGAAGGNRVPFQAHPHRLPPHGRSGSFHRQRRSDSRYWIRGHVSTHARSVRHRWPGSLTSRRSPPTSALRPARG